MNKTNYALPTKRKEVPILIDLNTLENMASETE